MTLTFPTAVIDTIKLAPHSCFLSERPAPDHWTVRRTSRNSIERQDRNGGELVLLIDESIGLKITATDHKVTGIEVSLSRLLFGSNGILIDSQSQLDNALKLLIQRIEEVAIFRNYSWSLRRVDLCWHFVGNTREFILALENVRHPEIRKLPAKYPDESLVWGARKSPRLRITIYDKTLESKKKQGDIVRVEIQLRKDKLREKFGIEKDGSHRLLFDQCYQIYRNTVSKLQPNEVPESDKVGITEILKMCELEGHCINEIKILDVWAIRKHSKTVSRMRKHINDAKLNYWKIDFSQLLPSDRCPPVVNLEI